MDVTATTTATNFGEARLAALPNARDFWTVLAAAPAIVLNRIDVGGSAAGTQTGYSAYDTKTDQHRPMVEGIVNTEGHGRRGVLLRLRRHRRSRRRDQGPHRRNAVAWRMVELHRQVGRQRVPRQNSTRDYQNKGIQNKNIDDTATFLCPSSRCGALQPSDLNRLESYRDLNGDVGGYVMKDKLWWYGSLRDQNVKVLLPNFPVKPFETGLRNVTGKGTYAISQNNKLTGYAQWGRKSQPNRLDTFAIGATAARHTSADSTWQQLYWGHTYKAGYESVLSEPTFVEVRGGQFRYVWPNYPLQRGSGVPGHRQPDRQRRQSRRLVPHAVAQPGVRLADLLQRRHGPGITASRWAASGSARPSPTNAASASTAVVPGDILHILNNGVAAQVYLFATPSTSEQGLLTTGMYVQDSWRVNSRAHVQPGPAFRPLPELPARRRRARRSGSSIRPSSRSPRTSNVNTFNMPVPRLGMVFDVTGKGRTVLKANYAQYAWNPGTALAENANNNPADWYRQYRVDR